MHEIWQIFRLIEISQFHWIKPNSNHQKWFFCSKENPILFLFSSHRSIFISLVRRVCFPLDSVAVLLLDEVFNRTFILWHFPSFLFHHRECTDNPFLNVYFSMKKFHKIFHPTSFPLFSLSLSLSCAFDFPLASQMDSTLSGKKREKERESKNYFLLLLNEKSSKYSFFVFNNSLLGWLHHHSKLEN